LRRIIRLLQIRQQLAELAWNQWAKSRSSNKDQCQSSHQWGPCLSYLPRWVAKKCRPKWRNTSLLQNTETKPSL